jgi:hypothetical protein
MQVLGQLVEEVGEELQESAWLAGAACVRTKSTA